MIRVIESSHIKIFKKGAITMPTENKNAEKKTVEIEVAPKPFKAFYQVLNTNTEQLSIYIHELFSSVFNDLAFVYIQPTPPLKLGGPFKFDIKLIFEKTTVNDPNKIDPLTNITVVNDNNRNNLFEVKRAQMNRASSQIYELSNEAKLVVAEFFPDFIKDKMNPKSKTWNNFIKQTITPSAYGYSPFKKSDRVFLEVTGLDMNKVLQKIYGDTMLNSSLVGEQIKTKASKCVYVVDMLDNGTPIKVLSGTTAVFNININKYDIEEVTKKFANRFPTISFQNPGFTSNGK